MAREFPVKFKDNYPSKSCIYKLSFGSKYLIVKAKAFKQSIQMVTEGIDRKIRLGYKPDDIYEKVLKHIKTSRVTFCTAEVLFQSDDHSELIAFESAILSKCSIDPLCLNISFDPYIPSWIAKSKINNLQSDVPTIQVKPIVTKNKTYTKPVKNPREVKSDLPVDLNDISDILYNIDKINATKDLKTRH